MPANFSKSLQSCVPALAQRGQLVHIKTEIDPYLELAEIQRRAYAQQGPALLFEQVKGTPFPVLSNLFGTKERTHLLFQSTMEGVKRVIQLKADPTSFLQAPHKYLGAPITGLRALPRKALWKAPVTFARTTLDQLPQLVSWPQDGGPYITLPQVYTEDPAHPKAMRSNVGMYRIQLGGNDFSPNEVGLHYQIHRGIGVHHSKAVERGERLKVSIFVGGPPAHTFGAVMPLPEGLTELTFSECWQARDFDM